MKPIFFVAIYFLFLDVSSLAQPGSLDSSFSKDGLVKTSIGSVGNTDARSIIVQSDGKIIIVGKTFGVNTNVFGVARYNEDGSPDNSFGTKGQVTTDFDGLTSAAQSIVIQSNGMLVVGGMSNNGSVMTRYKKNGSIDSSFGTNGKIIGDFGKTEEGIFSLKLQPDGKIVAGGTADGRFAVARYKQNGTRDSTFGTNGLVTTDLGHNSTSGGRALFLQPDGKIVLAGFTYDKHNAYDGAVIRYKKNGQLDTNFGNSGIVTTDLGTAYDTYTSLLVQPNGKINVAGYTGVKYHFDFALVQYNKNGTLDSSFGTNGFTTTDFDNVNDQANSLAFEQNGKIVVAGFTQSVDVPHYFKFALARYKLNANLDSSFGTNGQLVTDFGSKSADFAYAVIIQPDGKILVSGKSGYDAAIARYNPDSSNIEFMSKNYFISNEKFKNESNSVSLSPNPVKDILNLRGMTSNEKNIMLLNVSGNILQKIKTGNSNYSLDTRKLIPGVYFIKIIEGEKIISLRFVKN